MKNKSGFTLIEIIGVVTVLSIILIVAVPSLTRTLKRNEQNKYNDYIENLKIAAENYVVDKLASGGTLDGNFNIRIGDLIDLGYVKNVINNPYNNKPLSRNILITVSKDLDGNLKYDIHDQFEKLPDMYQQVEYIESTGEEYIDTNYMASDKTDILFDFEFLSGETPYIPIIGERVDMNEQFAFWIYQDNGNISLNYGNVDTYYIDGTNCIGRHIYEKREKRFYLDNSFVIEIPVGEFQAEYPLSLFGLNSGEITETRGINGRIYLMEIYENGNIVRNFVPCYRKSDGVIGLFDLVGETFYTNKGTGSFIKGSDV